MATKLFCNIEEDKTPQSIKKITKKILECWTSLGSLVCNIRQNDDNHFTVSYFPAVREIYGGSNDGQQLYPGFAIDVEKLVKFLKDPNIKISLDCLVTDRVPTLKILTFYENNQIQINLMTMPPSGQLPLEKIMGNKVEPK